MPGRAIVVLVAVTALAASAPEEPRQWDVPGGQSSPKLPPTNWQLKEGAPPDVSLVLERMKRQRDREFHAQAGRSNRPRTRITWSTAGSSRTRTRMTRLATRRTNTGTSRTT